MNGWHYVAAIVGFLTGVPVGALMIVMVKKLFLSIGPINQKIAIMRRNNEKIRKINLAAKLELDKLRACGPN